MAQKSIFGKKSPNVAFFKKGGWLVGWLGLMRYFSACMSGKNFPGTPCDEMQFSYFSLRTFARFAKVTIRFSERDSLDYLKNEAKSGDMAVLQFRV